MRWLLALQGMPAVGDFVQARGCPQPIPTPSQTLQAMLLMLVVALANAPNASGSAALPLLAAAAVAGVVTATVWLLAAAAAVRAQRERWALAAEFGVPLCYVAPLLIIFEGQLCEHIVVGVVVGALDVAGTQYMPDQPPDHSR